MVEGLERCATRYFFIIFLWRMPQEKRKGCIRKGDLLCDGLPAVCNKCVLMRFGSSLAMLFPSFFQPPISLPLGSSASFIRGQRRFFPQAAFMWQDEFAKFIFIVHPFTFCWQKVISAQISMARRTVHLFSRFSMVNLGFVSILESRQKDRAWDFFWK